MLDCAHFVFIYDNCWFLSVGNALYGRDARFDNKKCENTLRVFDLNENAMLHSFWYFVLKWSKQTSFSSKVNFRNVRNCLAFIWTLTCTKKTCWTKTHKNKWIWMILILEANLMKIQIYQKYMICNNLSVCRCLRVIDGDLKIWVSLRKNCMLRHKMQCGFGNAACCGIRDWRRYKNFVRLVGQEFTMTKKCAWKSNTTAVAETKCLRILNMNGILNTSGKICLSKICHFDFQSFAPDSYVTGYVNSQSTHTHTHMPHTHATHTHTTSTRDVTGYVTGYVNSHFTHSELYSLTMVALNLQW